MVLASIASKTYLDTNWNEWWNTPRIAPFWYEIFGTYRKRVYPKPGQTHSLSFRKGAVKDPPSIPVKIDIRQVRMSQPAANTCRECHLSRCPGQVFYLLNLEFTIFLRWSDSKHNAFINGFGKVGDADERRQSKNDSPVTDTLHLLLKAHKCAGEN